MITSLSEVIGCWMSPCISHRLRHITHPSLLGSLVLFAFCDHFCSEKKINQMCFYKVIEAFFYHFFFISSGFFCQTSSDQFVLQPQVKTVGLIHEKISWRNIKIKKIVLSLKKTTEVCMSWLAITDWILLAMIPPLSLNPFRTWCNIPTNQR